MDSRRWVGDAEERHTHVEEEAKRHNVYERREYHDAVPMRAQRGRGVESSLSLLAVKVTQYPNEVRKIGKNFPAFLSARGTQYPNYFSHTNTLLTHRACGTI
jgi:hypothetical protein